MSQYDALDRICISGFTKAARASTEGGRRFLYMEASNQSPDLQGEIVMRKALQDSAEYFLKFGNIDLDHRTMSDDNENPDGPYGWEVGRPVDVKFEGNSTLVKAEIYQGDADVVKSANMFWDSLTKQYPPRRWYPSVGGACQKATLTDPASGRAIKAIAKVRWTNIALSQTPVNPDLPTVTTVPIAALAKSLRGGIFHEDVLRKALTAGYGTDSSTLTGGEALRGRSEDDTLQNYFQWRENVSGKIAAKAIPPTLDGICRDAEQYCGGSKDMASQWADRFLRDVKRGLEKRKSS